MKTDRPKFGALLTALAVTAAIAGAASAGAATAEPAVPASREALQYSYASVVKRVAPAVVNVYTRRVLREQAVSPLFNDPMFRQFFGDRGPFQPQQRVQNALGSGVIVKADGTIVTNNHVIQKADQITVVLADRREFEARLVQADDKADLAVLKIDAHGEALPYLQFRDSDEVEVGDIVLAVGDPFGVGQTVTSGIVSGLARTNTAINAYSYFIQTDAAINPGNSGGALVTLDGRLIGINTAIFSQSGGSVGIGFAIPSNLVRTVLEDTTSKGRIVRPWLGVEGQAVTNEIAPSIGLDRPRGVLMSRATPDGPAARAGVKAGDVITAINGRDVDDPESLRYRIATLPVGAVARLSLSRRGDTREVEATLTAPPETTPRDTFKIGGQNPLTGATVANLSPALADELGLDQSARGVIITELPQSSAAAQLGLRPGDIIASINGRDTPDVASVRSALAQAQRWRVQIRRGDQSLTLSIG